MTQASYSGALKKAAHQQLHMNAPMTTFTAAPGLGSPNVQEALSHYYMGDSIEELTHDEGASATTDLVEQVAELVVRKLAIDEKCKTDVAQLMLRMAPTRAASVFSDLGGTAESR